jgi:hypothetical protein
MRSFLLALPVVASIFAVGCASPDGSDAAASSDELNASPAAATECVVNTVIVKQGFLADFESALDPKFITPASSQFFEHVSVPKVVDFARDPNVEDGEWFYTVIGTDVGPETLADGSRGPRLVASITGYPTTDGSLKTDRMLYDTAGALFDAMTRATETTTEHHAAPHTFDQSWKKVRRVSAGGHVACEQDSNPDVPNVKPSITCSFIDIDSTKLQIFSSKDTNGTCPNGL